jgi:hypothetical protein
VILDETASLRCTRDPPGATDSSDAAWPNQHLSYKSSIWILYLMQKLVLIGASRAHGWFKEHYPAHNTASDYLGHLRAARDFYDAANVVGHLFCSKETAL